MLEKLKKIFTGKAKMVVTDEFKNFFNKIESSNDNFFVTGNAGSGKSTFISYFRENSGKKIAVLAPTGLASINVRGQTIHSFFHFPPSIISSETVKRMHNNGRIYKAIDTLVIDEASMVRADMLDGIDSFLRRFGRDSDFPFGGIQIILVGDLFQLPPVVTNMEKPILERFYETPYFFSSMAFQQGEFRRLELTQIFRQRDEEFIGLLNKIRVGDVLMRDLKDLNERVKANVSIFRIKKAVTLTSTNLVADTINNSEMANLKPPELTYNAEIKGDFNERENNIPVPINLKLRKGARVMFVKNGGQWVNGTLGEISSHDEETIIVKLDETKEKVLVPQEDWEQIRYEYDSANNKINEKVIWTIKQFPLRLAWAITIHKSQGMTFDRVNIDYTRSPFAHGQTYVALSRCRTFEGLSLSKEIYPNDVIVDDRIIEFSGK